MEKLFGIIEPNHAVNDYWLQDPKVGDEVPQHRVHNLFLMDATNLTFTHFVNSSKLKVLNPPSTYGSRGAYKGWHYVESGNLDKHK